jgi:hypothetical protein
VTGNVSLLRLSGYLLVAAVAASAAVAIGCSEDEETGDGAAGSGGGGAGGDGGAGGAPDEEPVICPNENPPYEPYDCLNLNCPAQPPNEGPMAQKGACCFRTDNEAIRQGLEPGETQTITLVGVGATILTQPLTIGLEVVRIFQEQARQAGGETLLIRLEGIPREEDATGEVDIQVTIGSGRQNCDGTFSFYGQGAAPEIEGRTDPNRWRSYTLGATFDWDREPSYVEINDADRPPGVVWAPRWSGHTGDPVADLFYEQPVQDLDITIPNDAWDEQKNCVGSMDKNKGWFGIPTTTTFIPIAEADQAVIGDAAATLCSLFANGVDAKADGSAYTCEGPRVGGENPWTEKPDAFCTAEGCWIGVEDHEDFDPERDCNGSGRPCCDPTGESTELEACNAYFVKIDAVWASVTGKTTAEGEIHHITDPAEASPLDLNTCQ